jgi:peptidoglycan glycosyltransferase
MFWLVAALLTLLALNVLKISVFDAYSFITNPYNSRMALADNSVRRGRIIDAGGTVLAESAPAGDGYERRYPRGSTLAHAVGYSSFGRAGIESVYNFELQSVNMEFWSRLAQIATGAELLGNDVVLTADADFSDAAAKALGANKGAVVALDPSTGAVLAMASSGGLNPATIAEDWPELSASADSPLLNRATRGLYAPGSTFKLVTAAAAIENIEGWDTLSFVCEGEALLGGSRIICYDKTAHGAVTMADAFAVSCNTYFASVGHQMAPESVRRAAAGFMIGRPLGFALGESVSRFTLPDAASDSERTETAIGQGKTLATPLGMAVAAAAVANGGVVMKPYITDRIDLPGGGVKVKFYPETLGQAVSPGTAESLKALMVGCVENGTGAAAAVPGVSVAGKTGTAQNASGRDHSWFIGFAPADEPKTAIAVVIENAEPGARAAAVAGEILRWRAERSGD